MQTLYWRECIRSLIFIQTIIIIIMNVVCGTARRTLHMEICKRDFVLFHIEIVCVCPLWKCWPCSLFSIYYVVSNDVWIWIFLAFIEFQKCWLNRQTRTDTLSVSMRFFRYFNFHLLLINLQTSNWELLQKIHYMCLQFPDWHIQMWSALRLFSFRSEPRLRSICKILPISLKKKLMHIRKHI